MIQKKGLFDIVSKPKKIEVNIDVLNVGSNSLDNHFIILDENKKVKNVIDRVCNHAGGKLILKENCAVCPMHGWKLNLETLLYQDSHVRKTNIDYSIDGNKIYFEDKESYLINPFKNIVKGSEINIRYLNHATVYFSYGGVSLVTDPWLFGPAFMTGWWLDKASTVDSIEVLKDADYLYISHNHPDHLHPETLQLVDKNIKIIVGDFTTKSTEKYLRSLGFKNVISVDFNVIYEFRKDFQFSIFKSGDFRDDSGIYLNMGGMETLLTVDSNFLNAHILPKNIDLLLTSFAGGASGFPLCFENYELEQKLKIVHRNRIATRSAVLGHLKVTSPKHYMPYAGMFKEKADRDILIRENNLKNVPHDYLDLLNQFGIRFLEPKSNILYTFKDGIVTDLELDVKYLEEDNIDFYIEGFKNRYKYDAQKVLDYLSKSGYRNKQILYIIPTNDDFSEIVNEIIFCDFENQEFRITKEMDVKDSWPEYKTMKLYVRQEIFAAIVEMRLPWEDFSIGFQMKVFRVPNEYESEFWYHFTNVYIDPIHYKYHSNCGSCTVISQNPIFNRF
jgi:CMP-N-acetylneuraminate monooxygenase